MRFSECCDGELKTVFFLFDGLLLVTDSGLRQLAFTLMLEADKCDETIKEMKCGRVGMLVENLFSSQVGRGIDAAEITAMRDTAELYELDLVDDVGVLPPRLEKMFSVCLLYTSPSPRD